jgi:hypothetical protein
VNALKKRVRKAIENRFAGILDSASVLRWAAPMRAFRQICGWRPERTALTEARRILVIRPDEIGDVILTSPFLRDLRQAAPGAKITLLVKPACYPLVQHCPHADAVFTLKFASPWEKLSVLGVCWQAMKLKWTRTGGRGSKTKSKRL